jgi:hypothetical protein
MTLRVMAALELVRTRVKDREKKLHELRREMQHLIEYLPRAGPRERELLKQRLIELDARVERAAASLERSYTQLRRAPRPQATKAATPVNVEALDVKRQLEQTLTQVAGSAQ